MRAKLPALLLILALLVPLALAQQGRPTEDPRSPTADDRRGSHEEDDDGDDEDDQESPNRGTGRPGATARAAIGAFTLSTTARAVEGDYVSFTYNDTDLRDFQVAGVPLFDLHVSSEAEDDDQEALSRGAQMRLATPHFRMQVHDNPAGVLRLDTDGVATLLFAPGANLTLVDDERVNFTIGNLTGTVRGEDLEVAGRSVIASDEILVLVHAARGSFDVHRDRIGQAVAQRHVGAEASFNRRGDDDGVEEDVVSYGNVTLTKLKAERGNLTVLIDGHGFDGRVLVLNVDGRILGASKADDLHVLFDNETITLASSIQDILDPDDDGLQAEYYVVFDPAEGVFQILASVPHYSVHTLSVTTLLQNAPPSVIAGVLGGVLVLAASGAVLFRRKP